MRIQTIVVAGLFGLVACGPHIPKRPAGVPEKAFWAGDSRGGVFVAIGVPDHEGWQMKLYDDRSGALVGEGLYVIRRGLARPYFTQEDFAGWDGTQVLLKDGGALVKKR